MIFSVYSYIHCCIETCYATCHSSLFPPPTHTHRELPAMLFVSHLHLHLFLFILSLFIAKLATDIKQKPSCLVSLSLSRSLPLARSQLELPREGGTRWWRGREAWRRRRQQGQPWDCSIFRSIIRGQLDITSFTRHPSQREHMLGRGRGAGRGTQVDTL